MNAISDSDEKTWPPGAATPGADCDSKLGDVSMSPPLSGSTAEVLVPSAAMEPPAAHMSHLAPVSFEPAQCWKRSLRVFARPIILEKNEQ